MLFAWHFTSAQFLPYCVPPDIHSSCGAITNVSVGSLNHTSPSFPSSSSTYHVEYYCDSMPPTVLYRDSTYVLSITFDTALPSQMIDNSWYAIGIPFDTTGAYAQFYTPIRFYRTGSVMSAFSPVTDTFHVRVPHTAALGTTRLRIVRWGKGVGSSSITPRLCVDPASTMGMIGESNDFCLDIQVAPPVDTGIGTDTTSTQLSAGNIDAAVFSIFPNPANDAIQFPHLQSEMVAIRDLQGRTLYENNRFSGESLSVKSLSRGLYILSVSGKNYLFRKE
jgi:hypothetical protein